MTYKILSFDGGGIRGLVSAMLLQNLVGQPGLANLIDDADLLVGTSTGGLISLSLAAGQSVCEVVDVYKNKGAKIFQHYSDDYGATSVKYLNDGISQMAGQWLANFPTMSSLRSGSGRDVAVVAAQLWDPNALSPGANPQGSWMPRFISSLSGNPYTGLDPVLAALVTSAAPIYFPPVEIDTMEADYNSFYVDGGLVANNPLAFAVAQVVGAGMATPDDIGVISIGTATSSFGITTEDVKGQDYGANSWGASLWLDPFGSGPRPALPLLELALSMNEELSTAAAAAMFGTPNADGSRFLRAEPVIAPYAMDDYKDIGQLENDVAAYIDSDDWAQIVKLAPAVWGY
ncbi:patatin-like phospholipase family protein [Erythrobacter donghaensis]|jgi:patatin-like phospholipase/acyl hydrolase|uniref:patatin-like phospholipase family protein n=1 Tax=Erythrobacter donghaensis TaxID=267135 RepID=UPI00093E9779|nr:patatin-like phospholipase family protein [Erythrobacter donghaensis]